MFGRQKPQARTRQSALLLWLSSQRLWRKMLSTDRQQRLSHFRRILLSVRDRKGQSENSLEYFRRPQTRGELKPRRQCVYRSFLWISRVPLSLSPTRPHLRAQARLLTGTFQQNRMIL